MPLSCQVLYGSVTGHASPLLSVACQTDQGGSTGWWLSVLFNCQHTPEHHSSGCADCCSSRQHTDTLQGRACARDRSQQAISSQIPWFGGGGEGKEETTVCRAEPCCAAWPRGCRMVPGYFTYQTFPVCLNSPSVQEQQQHFPALQKISAFLMCCRNRCYFKYLPEMNPVFFAAHRDSGYMVRNVCVTIRILTGFQSVVTSESVVASVWPAVVIALVQCSSLELEWKGRKVQLHCPVYWVASFLGNVKKKSTVLFFLFHDQGQRMQENYPRVRKKNGVSLQLQGSRILAFLIREKATRLIYYFPSIKSAKPGRALPLTSMQW